MRWGSHSGGFGLLSKAKMAKRVFFQMKLSFVLGQRPCFCIFNYAREFSFAPSPMNGQCVFHGTFMTLEEWFNQPEVKELREQIDGSHIFMAVFFVVCFLGMIPFSESILQALVVGILVWLVLLIPAAFLVALLYRMLESIFWHFFPPKK